MKIFLKTVINSNTQAYAEIHRHYLVYKFLNVDLETGPTMEEKHWLSTAIIMIMQLYFQNIFIGMNTTLSDCIRPTETPRYLGSLPCSFISAKCVCVVLWALMQKQLQFISTDMISLNSVIPSHYWRGREWGRRNRLSSLAIAHLVPLQLVSFKNWWGTKNWKLKLRCCVKNFKT